MIGTLNVSRRVAKDGGTKRTSFDCVVAMYGVASDDATTRQTVNILIERGFAVRVVQLAANGATTSTLPTSASAYRVQGPGALKRIRPLFNLVRWWLFKSEVRRQIARCKPQVVVAIMLHGLAAVPVRLHSKYYKLVSCIVDIPNIDLSGKLDRRIIRRGWNRLRHADVVWASDAYKGSIAQEAGNLSSMPLICHNCPPRSYLAASTWPRDAWLRSELRKSGATIGETNGSILLRAGAIGEFGGIEETLEAMCDLPENFVFLMMGRPSTDYKEKLQSRVWRLNLRNRAFLWDRPSDALWKRALLGADIGHLIHGPFPPGPLTELFAQNSSLSNNRLFSYMAAGLPIISYEDARMEKIYKEVPCFQVARIDDLQADILRIWNELGHDELQRRLKGDAGRQAYRAKYYWEFQFEPILQALGCDVTNQHNKR